MKRCSYADKYLAVYPPRCGCDFCWMVWETKHGIGQARLSDEVAAMVEAPAEMEADVLEA